MRTARPCHLKEFQIAAKRGYGHWFLWFSVQADSFEDAIAKAEKKNPQFHFGRIDPKGFLKCAIVDEDLRVLLQDGTIRTYFP
jgi:hypothetical protein